MNLKILIAGTGMAVALLAVLGGGLYRERAPAPPSAAAAREAPAFALAAVDGRATFSGAALRGRPAVLNFWATWCPGCVAEHGTLQAVAREFKDRAGFLGISVDEDPAAVRDFLRRNGSDYPVALDPGAKAASAFGVAGVPQTFFLDAHGVIVATLRGPADGKALREILDVLLAKKDQP